MLVCPSELGGFESEGLRTEVGEFGGDTVVVTTAAAFKSSSVGKRRPLAGAGFGLPEEGGLLGDTGGHAGTG